MMKVSRVLLFSLFAVKAIGYPVWNELLDFQEIEQRLAQEKIESIKPIHQDHPTVKLIRFQNGLKGVFKDGEYRFAECAAYKASNALGLRLVPPTIMRTINGKEGSLQFFIEDAQPLNPRMEEALDEKVISDMRVFYYVFGQWDAHAENQLVTKHNGSHYLVLIDNAGIYHRVQTTYGGELFIEKGDENPYIKSHQTPQFPYDKAKKISTKAQDKMYQLFGSVIPGQLPSLIKHSDDITYVFWRDTLWMKRPSLKTTKTFYRSTLNAITALDRTILEEIWSAWMALDPRHAGQLIDLTLLRRDEILNFAHSRGTIIDDLVSSQHQPVLSAPKKIIALDDQNPVIEPIAWTLEQLVKGWSN